ncbi:MAG: tRNA (adenosine(37)-N6)-threonylcarbamoyltransferase complex dimerization subunit type 1 TsaB [Pseudomonadota bacterium]
MILAIDTSAGQCAVALVGGRRPVVRAERMTRGHAEALFPMIDAVLAETGASYGDLTRIAVCTGPGSFTGIRAGVAAARGLALGLGVPAVGISRLEAVGHGLTGHVVLRGRADQLYLQQFNDGRPKGAPFIATGLPDGKTIGDGIPLHSEEAVWPDLFVLAELADARDPSSALPAPLYLRGPDADPPRDGPPVMLD